jgi:hypothetical protein
MTRENIDELKNRICFIRFKLLGQSYCDECIIGCCSSANNRNIADNMRSELISLEDRWHKFP